jgi:hypothetical protein
VIVRTLPKSLRGIKVNMYYSTYVYLHDSKLLIVVETDISDFAIDAILSQKEERVQLVIFYSRKMIVTELNYDIND